MKTTISSTIGEPVEIDDWQWRGNKIRLENIRIGASSEILIPNLEFIVKITPFSQNILTFDRLSIEQAKINISIADQNLAPKISENSTKMGSLISPYKEKAFAVFEKIAKIDAFSARKVDIKLFSHTYKKFFQINDLQISKQANSQAIHFRFAGTQWQNSPFSPAVSGKVHLSKAKQTLTLQAQSIGKSDWRVLARIKRKKSADLIHYSLREIPREIAHSISPRVSIGENLHITGTLKARENRKGDIQIRSKLAIKKLEVFAKNIAPTKVSFEGINADTKLYYNRKSRVVNLREVYLSTDKLDSEHRVSLKGIAKLNEQGLQDIFLSFEVPTIPCQKVWESIPKSLIPTLNGFALSGNFSASADLQFHINEIENFHLEIHRLKNQCRIKTVPLEFTKSSIIHPIKISAFSQQNQIDYKIFQSSPEYTVLDDISTHLLNAILSSEDSSFFQHRGVSFRSLEMALRRNLAKESISVGGSTITMQTTKNLFLSHERTVSRKLQEIFLTFYLENIFTKQEILELYANIIEFGPGIIGINRAARHYFRKTPADLNIEESAFLAKLLPNPNGRYQQFCLNQPTQNFRRRMNQLVQRMNLLGKISTVEMQQALSAPLAFNAETRRGSYHCDVGSKQQISISKSLQESAEYVR